MASQSLLSEAQPGLMQITPPNQIFFSPTFEGSLCQSLLNSSLENYFSVKTHVLLNHGQPQHDTSWYLQVIQ